MVLKEHHRAFAREWLKNGNDGTKAYLKIFKMKDRGQARIAACNMLKRPEVKAYVEKLAKAKEERLMKGRDTEIAKWREEVITELELDVFHSKIVRGELQTQEVVQIKIFTPAQYDKNGYCIAPPMWTTRLELFTRPASLIERQRSASELYKRKGSYASGKRGGFDGDSDSDGEGAPVQDFLILSNGTMLPMPKVK